MVSTKIKFRPSKNGGKEGTVLYQLIHERKVRVYTTNYHIFPDEWDSKHGTIKIGDDKSRTRHLCDIRQRIRWDMERIAKIIRNLDYETMQYTVDDIVAEFERQSDEARMFLFMEKIIAELKRNGKTRTAETYATTLNSFKLFRKGDDIRFEGVDDELIRTYESWLKRNGLVQNTTSFYMRILRAVYNRAVEQGLVESKSPFRHVYTGVDKTVKRAVPLGYIKRIRTLDLSDNPCEAFSRDIFLLSFALRGMSFIDMAYLKKSDLRNGFVTYRRRKTGQSLRIKWTREMQAILDKYPPNPTRYLLPIIYVEGPTERGSYKYYNTKVNSGLKKIAAMIGLPMPLTLYCARHSWASVAKAKGIPVSVISEGMGHDSEATTQIYLASLDSSVVDRANSMLIRAIF